MSRRFFVLLLATACGPVRSPVPFPDAPMGQSVVLFEGVEGKAFAMPLDDLAYELPTKHAPDDRVDLEALVYSKTLDALALKFGRLEPPRFAAEGAPVPEATIGIYRTNIGNESSTGWKLTEFPSDFVQKSVFRFDAGPELREGLVLQLRSHLGLPASVNSWPDLSGEQHDFEALGDADAVLDPDRKIGAHPSVVCSPGTGFENNDRLLTPDAPRTIVLVATAVTDESCSLFGFFDGDQARFSMEVVATAGTQLSYGVQTPNGTFSSDASLRNLPRIHVLRTEALDGANAVDTIDYRIDGRSIALSLESGSAELGPLDGFDATRLCRFDDVNPTCVTSVAEVLVYDRRLSDDETTTLEDELAIDFGLTP